MQPRQLNTKRIYRLMEITYHILQKDQLIYKLPEFNYTKPQDENNPKEPHKLSVYIAGGAVRDSLFGERFSDIDIFGLTKEDLDMFVKLNLTKHHGYKLVYFNDNLRTYKKGILKFKLSIENTPPFKQY